MSYRLIVSIPGEATVDDLVLMEEKLRERGSLKVDIVNRQILVDLDPEPDYETADALRMTDSHAGDPVVTAYRDGAAKALAVAEARAEIEQNLVAYGWPLPEWEGR